jgi:hypothetical protein
MYYQRRGILSYITKTPVLILYVSFFIVQMFFNFDIANSSNKPALYKIEPGNHFSVIKKINTEKDKKQTTRLNKRFKPQAILTYYQVSIKSPAYRLETRIFVSHADIFIPATFLLSQSFRGPPVVA